MSSSTSSSRAALAALGFVFATLVLCELALRVGEQSLSLDVAHLRSIPVISKRLARGEGQRVLFLGSSIVRAGVNLDAVRRVVRGSGLEPLTVERVHPDDSRIAEWTYLIEHHFVDAGRLPDVVVIGFAGSHLEDHYPIPWDRIAAYYSSTPELPRIISDEINDFESRVQFVLAHFLRSFAYRERIGKRVLDLFVPHYRDSSRRINESLRREYLEATAAKVRQYTRVERLAELTRRHRITLVLVAMPLRSAWEISPELRKRAGELGVKLIDARDIPGMGPQSYRDGMHMNASGAERFSGWLLEALTPILLETRGRAATVTIDLDID